MKKFLLKDSSSLARSQNNNVINVDNEEENNNIYGCNDQKMKFVSKYCSIEETSSSSKQINIEASLISTKNKPSNIETSFVCIIFMTASKIICLYLKYLSTICKTFFIGRLEAEIK